MEVWSSSQVTFVAIQCRHKLIGFLYIQYHTVLFHIVSYCFLVSLLELVVEYCSDRVRDLNSGTVAIKDKVLLCLVSAEDVQLRRHQLSACKVFSSISSTFFSTSSKNCKPHSHRFSIFFRCFCKIHQNRSQVQEDDLLLELSMHILLTNVFLSQLFSLICPRFVPICSNKTSQASKYRHPLRGAGKAWQSMAKLQEKLSSFVPIFLSFFKLWRFDAFQKTTSQAEKKEDSCQRALCSLV